MAFPPSFLDELRNRLSLVSVIGRKVKLLRRGREHTGLCPFHNEKTPSFTVNEDKGFFHCFGCGAHGDVIAFEMRASHLTFPEAVERLAAEVGLEPPKATPEERAQAARQAGLHEVMEAACAFYERQLRSAAGRHALDYLRGRGLSEDTITRFRLGFSPDSRDALKTALMGNEMPESLLIEAGLLIKPEGGGASYDRFRGRVMFPIGDRRGRIIAFGGRIMGEGQPKYLNSPDTPLFHKGSVLYAMAQAREPARSRNRVIVAEGYMDVIALAQAGFEDAVAPLGTALTEQQIEELWRLADEPVLCFDGDAAGQRAAAKAMERALPLLKPGKSLRFAVIPPPEDPDSLIKARGPQAMLDVIERADPLIEVLWRSQAVGRPLDTPERRAALEKDLKDKAFTIADSTVQKQYLRAISDKLWQAFRPVRPERQRVVPGQGKKQLQGVNSRLPRAPRPLPPPPPEVMRERLMLVMVLNHPHLLETVGERLGMVHFADKELDNLRQEILKHLDEGSGLDSQMLQSHLRSCGWSRLLDTLLGSGLYELYSFCRPDAPAHDARAGWEHTFTLYSRKELKADIGQATLRLAEEMSEQSFGHLRALTQQQVADPSENEK
ncbi:DNA primase [Telmatospirillum sp. J64-1]|uniref:DNA primase n=1 Tax=Telmatospirillum sp. J64-1 TaxID=2502183 RepID=UPI00115E1A62|nr:DNA primase [Telmatospirillum sp. J64-1]